MYLATISKYLLFLKQF